MCIHLDVIQKNIYLIQEHTFIRSNNTYLQDELNSHSSLSIFHMFIMGDEIRIKGDETRFIILCYHMC